MTVELPTLLSRVEGLSGPDREVDALITVTLRLDCPRNVPDDLHYLTVPHRDDHCAPGTYWYHQRSGMSLRTAAPLTGSLDAVLALVERVRPGWMWSIGQLSPEHNAVAELCCENPAGYSKEEAPTPSLALLLALLRSMEAEGEH